MYSPRQTTRRDDSKPVALFKENKQYSGKLFACPKLLSEKFTGPSASVVSSPRPEALAHSDDPDGGEIKCFSQAKPKHQLKILVNTSKFPPLRTREVQTMRGRPLPTDTPR